MVMLSSWCFAVATICVSKNDCKRETENAEDTQGNGERRQGHGEEMA